MAGPLDELPSLASLGSLVGGTLPANVTPEEIKRRRAVQGAIAAQKRKFPTTLGEGMTYLGEAVGERMADNRLAEAERLQAGRDTGAPMVQPGRVAPAGAFPGVLAPAATPGPAAANPNAFEGTPIKTVPTRKAGSDTLDKLAALLNPDLTAQEVPQENPMLAGATPPQEAGGPTQPDPVQLAALGGPAGTMSDAPQPGFAALPPANAPVPVTAADNPPTPTDIQPMPVKTAQVGAPPAGVLPGSDASMFAPPSFRPSPRAGDTSQGISPAPTPTPYPNPGPAPAPPGISPTMAQNLKVANDRMYSDHIREEAARRYKEEGTQRHEVYKQTFDMWKEAKQKERDYALADPKTRLELKQAHLNALKTQREIEGEGGTPMTAAQRAAFGIGADKAAWFNRRGEPVVKDGGTTVNVSTGNNGEETAVKEFHKKVGADWAEKLGEGMTAADDLKTISDLRVQATRINTGPEAVAKQWLGKLGVKTEGVGAIEAMDATINRLIPSQRLPGSGATSDFDARGFRASLPGLMNTREGNMMIMDTMEGLARNKMQRAEIISQWATGEMKMGDAIKKMAGLQAEARMMSDRAKSHVESMGVKLPEPVVPARTGVMPPPGAIEELRRDPSKRRYFDQEYGAGSSNRFLDF